MLGQLLEVRFTMISGIGGDHGGLRPHRLHGLHHRNKQFLLLPHAVGLGVHDNLVLLVNDRHAGVSLDNPLARSHLGRIVVGAVGLPEPPSDTSTVLGVSLEPGADLLGLLREALDLSRLTLAQRGLAGVGEVLLAMPRQHSAHGAVHLLRFASKLLARTAAGALSAARRVRQSCGPHGSEHRFRAYHSRFRRGRHPRNHARTEPAAAARREGAGGLEAVGLLRLL